MTRAALFTLLGVAVVTAVPTGAGQRPRIVGGELTTIDHYPYAVSMQNSLTGLIYIQYCGGTLINSRSILTAAQCFIIYRLPFQWRARVGSSFANTGGTTYSVVDIIRHPNFGTLTLDNDIAIVRTTINVVLVGNVQSASIAGPNYNPGDDREVWNIGWGATCEDCSNSPQLQHVQVRTINQGTCVARYAELNMRVTNNMLCSGWLDVGGRDRCYGDAGGPVLQNDVVIGVSSWGSGCAHPRYPAVNARVSTASDWIVANA